MTVYLFDMDGTLTPPRLPMTEDFADTFVPYLEISVGGSISIDITPVGCGKGQIAQHVRNAYPDENIVFMGDRTLPGGNDHELAMALTLLADTETIQVSGPEAVINELNLR